MQFQNRKGVWYFNAEVRSLWANLCQLHVCAELLVWNLMTGDFLFPYLFTSMTWGLEGIRGDWMSRKGQSRMT